MGAALIPAMVLEETAAIGAAAGEAIGMAEVGTAAEYGINQGIGAQINKTISYGADKLGRTVLGDENVDNIEKTIQGAKTEAWDIAKLALGGNYNTNVPRATIGPIKPHQLGDVVSSYTMSDLHSDAWEPDAFLTYINSEDYKDADPRFKEIFRIYTGEMSKPVQNTGGFHFVDETGKLVSWEYPKWNTYIPIPPMYGTWVGYKSPNNRLPAINSLGKADILDQIAMGHDIDYHQTNHGVFSQEADWKFISRLLHQYPKMNSTQKMIAKIALKWFTTGGHLARYFFGPEKENETIEPQRPPQVLPSANDIFNNLNAGGSLESIYNTYMQNQQTQQNNRDSIFGLGVNLVNQYADQQVQAVQPVRNNSDSYSQMYDSMAARMPALRNYVLQQQLGSLEIELL